MSDEESVVEKVIVFVVVRILYFMGSFVILGFGAVRYGGWSWRIWSDWSSPAYWIGIGIVSVFVAIFGPYVYQQEVERGRGDLRRIREASRNRERRD